MNYYRYISVRWKDCKARTNTKMLFFLLCLLSQKGGFCIFLSVAGQNFDSFILSMIGTTK